jgi:hypothetical protein
MPPGLSLGPPTRLEVRWRVLAPGTGLRGVTPLTDVAAAVARRGELRSHRAVMEGILRWVVPGP